MNASPRNARAAERYAEEIRRCPKGGNGVHSWMMTTANLAAIAGIPPMDAEAEIIRSMSRPPSPSSEVAAAIRKAYAEYTPGADYTPRKYSAPRPKPLPQTAQAFIRRGDGAEESDWWEASPIRIDWEPGPEDALFYCEHSTPRRVCLLRRTLRGRGANGGGLDCQHRGRRTRPAALDSQSVDGRRTPNRERHTIAARGFRRCVFPLRRGRV